MGIFTRSMSPTPLPWKRSAKPPVDPPLPDEEDAAPVEDEDGDPPPLDDTDEEAMADDEPPVPPVPSLPPDPQAIEQVSRPTSQASCGARVFMTAMLHEAS